jgi:iron complex outermembrane receptor protein
MPAVGASAALGVLLGATATAATAGPDTARAVGELDEIVVTARKRQEDLQSIPISVSALSETQIADAHITRMDDLAFLVPNLNITTRADNTPDVVMRGIGAFGVTQGVGFYVNDVQLFEGQTVRAEDLERIEVLKGPQGTLYGGNNIGGAIKYITKRPSREPQAEATVELGNLAARNFSGAVSGPIAGVALKGRLSVFDSTSDGFVLDPTLDRKLGHSNERGGRLTLEYEAAQTNVTFFLYGNRLRSDNENLYYAPPDVNTYSRTTTANVLPHFTRDLYSPALEVEHEFGEVARLTSITSYFHSDVDARADGDHTALPLFDVTQQFHRNIWSEELRLASVTGNFNWLIGGFVQRRESRDLEINTQTLSVVTGDPADDGVFTSANHASRREYAGFANASYSFGKWSVEGGLRLERFDNRLTDTLNGGTYAVDGTMLLPKASLSYKFDPDVMAYVTITRGLQPADVLQAHGQVSSFDSQKTLNYEAGMKSSFLDDHLRFNTAVFYITYDNRLFSTIDGATLQEVTKNVGPSHNYGVEADVAARITRSLTVSGGFGVTEAVWGNIPGYFNPNTGTTINLDGMKAPYAPAYQGTLTLDWKHALTRSINFGARVDASFTGSQSWNISDDYREKPYHVINAGIRFEEGDHWRFSANVMNLFDVEYHTVFASGPDIGAPRNTAGFSRPRMWFVSATVKY